MHYAGDLSPEQAWNLLSSDQTSHLVDVRTDAEWTFVGLPDLSTLNKQPVLISWQVFPAMQRHVEFVDTLAKKLGKDQPVAFICRSGARSGAAAAAMTAAGFQKCFNITGGFEGDIDDAGHRGKRNGWKAAQLPWRQG